MKYFYKPEGTCSKDISFELENNKIKNVKFHRGCSGGLYAICKLIEGKDIDDVINIFQGIKCPGRDTSCPDQLSEALLSYKEQYDNMENKLIN